MTFLHIFIWVGGTIIVLLIAAVFVVLGYLAVQDRRISNAYAEQVRDELSEPAHQLKPHVPKPWQFSANDLNDPQEERPRDTPPA